MTSTQRCLKAIKGEPVDRTPIYGWLKSNLEKEITTAFGSVEAFEDRYEFDAAHLFGGPDPFDRDAIKKIIAGGEELTPDILLDMPLKSPDNLEDYKGFLDGLKHHKEDRGRFCYAQTPGLFELYNSVFGIENQLCYLILYKDEIAELYKRQAEWNRKFAENILDLGVNMVHISDDWGQQRGLLFNPQLWWELIYPNMKIIVDAVKRRNGLVSLHSDGCIVPVLDGIADLGFDVLHPWQESAGMSYDLYLNKYRDTFGIMGGLCIQTTLGFGNYKRLESEIRRVFGLLKGKRWIFCTTHFVQSHCSMEELTFAYNLAYTLARG
ncbi:MAG: uroporphyrinogen decarboxylase family protein [Clostridiaceae bacterium]|nr:uroporphyrinogen decarboxylase family protein [Clostridiaceae bacterium]